MAEWTDDLLDAALDGVQFYYEDVEHTGGRRTVTHQFPKRDTPHTQDFGRLAFRERVRAFVIGDGYATTRNLLMGVLDAGGNHTFTHPRLGDMTVKLEGEYKMTETDQKGGYAEFNFTLVEAGLAFPLVTFPTLAKIDFLAADALEKLSTKTKFSLLGAIGAVLTSVRAGIDKATNSIRKVNGKISSALNLVDNISSAIDDFESATDALMSTPQALMSTMLSLANSAMSLVKDFIPPTITIEVEAPEIDFIGPTLEGFEELTEFETVGTVIPTPIPQSVIEEAAHLELTKSVQAAGLIASGSVFASLDLESAEQAAQIAQLLNAKFDDLLEHDFDTDIVEALYALKATLVAHFAQTASQLPTLTTFVPNDTIPTLPLVYDLYEDLTRDTDVIKRNKIRHPAFVQGGKPLSILSK
jgi:prophage DNA circulation protein